MAASIQTSVRLPQILLDRINYLRGDRPLTDVVNEALTAWADEHQRQQWGREIAVALKGRSQKRNEETRETTRIASHSGLRAVESK